MVAGGGKPLTTKCPIADYGMHLGII